MPKLSVISIARREDEFQPLRSALAKQSFRDFEFVTSTKRSIPEAWNDAISKSRGDFLVFTESDAVPLNDHWLDEIAAAARQGCVMKGLEIRPSDPNLSNLVCDARIFQRIRFDESFQVCEDTELFARLRKMGTSLEFVNAFPVVHVPSGTWRKTLSRALRIGMYFMKIIYLHGRANIDDVNTRNFQRNSIPPISNRFRVILENLLVLFGLLIGAILYFPISLRRVAEKNDRKPHHGPVEKDSSAE